MVFLKVFIIITVFYVIFNWIFKKTDFHNRVSAKFQKHKFARVILIFILFFIAFWIEVEKQSLKEIYGEHSILSIIAGAFLGSFYWNFAPLIFRRNKS